MILWWRWVKIIGFIYYCFLSYNRSVRFNSRQIFFTVLGEIVRRTGPFFARGWHFFHMKHNLRIFFFPVTNMTCSYFNARTFSVKDNWAKLCFTIMHVTLMRWEQIVHRNPIYCLFKIHSTKQKKINVHLGKYTEYNSDNWHAVADPQLVTF